MSTVHPIRPQICVASDPIENDLGCGFQSSLSSGTRSSVFRVLPISWSNSGSSASLMFIRVPSVKENVYRSENNRRRIGESQERNRSGGVTHLTWWKKG